MIAIEKVKMRHRHTHLMMRRLHCILRHLPHHFALMRLLGRQGHGICRIETNLNRRYINSRFTHA